MPKSCTATMFGWLMRARACASRWKRSGYAYSPPWERCRIFTATALSSRTWRPRYTAPMPPMPIISSSTHEPSGIMRVSSSGAG